jgi:hypothetical protein
MVAARDARNDRGMGRLVAMWTRPHHLSPDEADAWTHREAARLAALDWVAHAELTRLQNASSLHPANWDWMLELHLRDDADPHACADTPAFADWLLDLRLLGMRPSVITVTGSTRLVRRSG